MAGVSSRLEQLAAAVAPDAWSNLDPSERLKIVHSAAKLAGARLRPVAASAEELARMIEQHLADDVNLVERFRQAFRTLVDADSVMASSSPGVSNNLAAILHVLWTLRETAGQATNSTNDKYPTFDFSTASNRQARTAFDETTPNTASASHTQPVASSSQRLRTSRSSTVPEEPSETALLRDIMFVLQGIDGQYIRWDSVQDNYSITASCGVHSSTRDLIGKMVEAGWLFRKLRSFVDNAYGRSAPGHLNNVVVSATRHVSAVGGLVGRAFCSAVEQDIEEYYRLLCVLEQELRKVSAGGLTLRRLFVWLQGPLRRMQFLAALTDAVRGTSGGQLLSVMHFFGARHGSPKVRGLVRSIMQATCEPFLGMVRAWLLRGELCDPQREFFVIDTTSDQLNRTPDTIVRNVTVADIMTAQRDCRDHDAIHSGGAIWNERFLFRKEYIPAFFSSELAQRIYRAGKAINFLRLACGDQAVVGEISRVVASLPGDSSVSFSSADAPRRNLQQVIDGTMAGNLAWLYDLVATVSQMVNERLTARILHPGAAPTTSGVHKTLAGNFAGLRDHCEALKNYVLLGHGDFAEALMELLHNELSRPASELARHSLLSTLETAVQQSIALHDPLTDRLDIRLIDDIANAADNRPRADGRATLVGWDVVALEYRVSVPEDAVLTPKTITNYLVLFNRLWRIKRAEHALNATWRLLRDPLLRRHAAITGRGGIGAVASDTPVSWEAKRSIDFLRRVCALRNEMHRVVSQLQFFVLSEVIECSWDRFLHDLDEIDEFEDLIAAHTRYMDALLTRTSNLGDGVKRLLALSLQFCGIVTAFHSTAEKSNSSDPQIWLTASTIAKVQQLSSAFDETLVAVRRHFARQRIDEDLRFLSARLDFSDFYATQRSGASAATTIRNPPPAATNSENVRSHSHKYTTGTDARPDPNQREAEQPSFILRPSAEVRT